MDKTVVFKVIDKEGKFSTGGVRSKFTTKGKLWKTLGHLKNHFKQFLVGKEQKEILRENLNSWEIIEYELVEKRRLTVLDVMSKGDALEAYEIISKL